MQPEDVNQYLYMKFIDKKNPKQSKMHIMSK